ncbi:MAG TPA: MFS transporter [Verrucomicrobiae bacterium]|nr:MFS transporter [Verrucomicrobiae bacterium]
MKTRASEESLLQSLRQLPRPVWILFAGTFLNKFGAFVIPFLSLYMTGRGFSVTQAGAAMGAYGAGHFLACVVGGQLADSLGRRPTLVLSMFSTAGVMLALSQATSFVAIAVLTFFAGLTGELYRPACSALLADLVPQGQRLRAFAAYRMAFNAGWALGPATAGLIAKYSFTWLFIGDAVTSFLYGVIALAFLPKGIRSERKEAGWGEALAVMRQDRRFQRLLLSSLLIGLVFFQMVSTFGLHVTTLGFSAWTYGIIISLNGLLVVLFELPLTTVSQRFGFERSMIIGYILTGIGFGGNAFAATIPAIIACLLVWSAGEMLTMPVAVAQAADLAPAHMRGRYMGAFGFTWAIALMIGPLIGTALFRWHPAALWGACAAASFAAAFVTRRTPRNVSMDAKLIAVK